jgi:CO dehydrogenase/acetyl-CoA synthase delta subunit
MSTFTPSNDDILPPNSGTPQKNRSPLWVIVTTLVLVFCCCCLCMGLLTTWLVRFGLTFLGGLFGGF